MKTNLFYALLLLFLCNCEKEVGGTSSNNNENVSKVVNIEIAVKDFNRPTISVKIYMPKGYDPSNLTIKYNAIIFLHGASPNDYNFISNVVKPSMDTLTKFGKMPPTIVIMPSLIHPKEPSYGNRHFYLNSEFYGNYENVIFQILDYLNGTTEQNFKEKILTDRSHLSIAGFSMGADGALRIGLRHPDKFVAIASHGAAPTFSYEVVNSFILSNLLFENQNSKDVNGNYVYKPQNGFLTEAMWGLSAAFSSLKNGEIQFLFNPNGTINSDLHQDWLKKADCKTIILTNKLYQTKENSPHLYFEVGSLDNFVGYNDYFIFKELAPMGIANNYYQYVVSQGLGHGLEVKRAMGSLEFLGSKFSR